MLSKLRWTALLLALMMFLSAAGCKSKKKDDGTATTKDNVLVKAAHMSDEKITISQMRAVHRAEQMYHAENNRYASMDELIDKGMLTRDPSGHLSYKYSISPEQDRYQCSAVPQVYGTSGRFSFYIDENGEVYGGDHHGGAASTADEKIVN